jgi:hypothetical protein
LSHGLNGARHFLDERVHWAVRYRLALACDGASRAGAEQVIPSRLRTATRRASSTACTAGARA